MTAAEQWFHQTTKHAKDTKADGSRATNEMPLFRVVRVFRSSLRSSLCSAGAALLTAFPRTYLGPTKPFFTLDSETRRKLNAPRWLRNRKGGQNLGLAKSIAKKYKQDH